MNLHVPEAPDWHTKLVTVGVTGTDGKTSTAAMIAAILAIAAAPVARITSIGAFVGDEALSAPRGYATLLKAMRSALTLGGRFAVVEWASWSLAHGFLASWPPRVGVVTNVTRDHLDIHGSLAAYLDSKAALVESIDRGGFVVLNDRDPHSGFLAARVRTGTPILWYGGPEQEGGRDLDVLLHTVGVDWSGTTAEVRVPGHPTYRMHLRMVGGHFAENAAAALTTAIGLGIEPTAAIEALGRVPSPPGRFELVCDRPRVVVDFAHTPHALHRTLETARALTRGRLVVVFGAGGNRDPGKRPLLGQAAQLADRIVLTSDNPRFEDPRAIIHQIRSGVPPGPMVDEEADRRRAIERTLMEASETDTIVIAGRGRDSHQLIGAHWHPMDDAEIAQRQLAMRRPSSR